MRRSRILASLIALIAVLPAVSQTGDFNLSVAPTFAVPIGPVIDGDLQMYGIGGGATLRGDFVPGFARYLYGRASLDFDLLPLNGADDAVTLLAGGGSLGLTFSPSPRLALKVGGGGGIYMAMSGLGTVRNPYVEGGAELSVRMSPSMAISLGGRYMHLFTPTGPLYQGIAAQIGISYDLAGARKGTEIRLEQKINPIFPLFYSYYDKNPAGELSISNGESTPYEKVKVSFYAKQYMDGPRLCADLGTLKGGETKTAPVFALFNDSIFRVTEGTKAAGEVIVEYFYLGKEKKVSFPVTVQVQNRNAMTWDDDRKAAAFVTAKDPLILGFSKNVASTVRYEGAPPVSEDFRIAFALFQALTTYNLGYAVDPKTPYTALSEKQDTVDFLQFPNQTLAYRAGDCDDISVLYAALLESVGVPAALVTTPGHIFVAFDPGLPPDSAGRLFAAKGELIVRDGRAWVPVEVTLVKDGFVRAWRTGAQEWREAEAVGKAAFYPIREAWGTYEPVGFVEGGIAVSLPSPERIVEGYRKEMAKFLEAQVGPRIAAIQAEDRAAKKTADQTANRIGVVYAQFGLLDKAAEQFQIASRRGTYAPAVTNLGNVLYLQGDMKTALRQYEKAMALAPASAAALAGAARALYALDDIKRMNEVIAKLKTVNPELAAKIDLTGGTVTTARASEAVSREVGAWDE
ncbi:MAG TPA: transglutaminase family protein [Spirochaetales bacterium]|nr:transglutaminase family protein [Spirochaetales bacterium]